MPMSPTCECGKCQKCAHREYVRRWRARVPIERRMERWMSSFAAVYWTQVHRKGARRLRFTSGYRN